MPTPNVLILRAPGTNCDGETAFAFQRAGARTETLHVNRLLENPRLFERFQILCVPGGFSYGDDVAAGRILGNQIQHHLDQALAEFKEAGKLMLGICNGFQVLLKSPVLLPPDPARGPRATLTLNDSGRYEDRWVRLKVQSDRCVFLQGIDRMYLPVAHAEGKFVARDEQVLEELIGTGQTVLRYIPQDERSEGSCSFPDNPNGSTADVAGICDVTGRVFGLMPHPERHIDPTQHPRWTRGEAGSVGDGLQIFVNAVKYFY
ncbi:MAG: phosphoribosylformylglycinamidine synthase I [Pirellulales bacterium]|nr:phosphoribosylformylglycinamidine synthase I [Pirellulales bacterium]